MVVNHGTFGWASGREPWWVIQSQWLWIMWCFAGPSVVIHCELCGSSGCETWWVMLSQWLWIMECYSESVCGNHGVLCCTSCCESYVLFTLSIFYCSIRNNWIRHKFHNLETSSPIHTSINTKLTYIILYTYFILIEDMKKTKTKPS